MPFARMGRPRAPFRQCSRVSPKPEARPTLPATAAAILRPAPPGSGLGETRLHSKRARSTLNSGRLFVDDKFKPRASGCGVALRSFRNRSSLRYGASGGVKERSRPDSGLASTATLESILMLHFLEKKDRW